MDQNIRELTPEDVGRIEEQEAVVSAMLQDLYGARLTHTELDLDLLQRVLDHDVLAPGETYLLQCLGIVLGQVFATQTPLRWITIEDEYGQDPALQYPGTSVVVFPLTMISKRIEEGRDVDVILLYQTVKTEVEQMKDDPEYQS